MENLLQYREHLEIIYFICAPLLLTGLIIGMIQINLFKKDMEIRYRRESVRETLSIFERKISKIEFFKEKLWDVEAIEGMIDLDEKNIINFEILNTTEGNDWLEAFNNSAKVHNHSIDLLNEIDTLAQFILSGLADEEIAYRNEGSYFILVVSDFRRYISAHIRDDLSRDAYKATIELFSRWHTRQTKEKLLLQHRNVSDEIKKIKMPKEVKTIGR